MTTMNISLPDELKVWVDQQVATGGYGSTSEYIRELIRDAHKRAARARLEALLIEGLESGEPKEITPAFWDEVRAEVAKRVNARKSRDANGR